MMTVEQNETSTLPTPVAPRTEPGPWATRRLLDARDKILNEQPDRTDFLHTVMCQVGMPRRKTEARLFERQCGNTSILLEAGRLWNGKNWIEQPLPYGTPPRLVMVHLSSEAIRTKSRSVEI